MTTMTTPVIHRTASSVQVPLLPVKTGPMLYDRSRVYPGFAVYRNGRQIAEVYRIRGHYAVNVTGLGVSIHEPDHATVADALAWHGWARS